MFVTSTQLELLSMKLALTQPSFPLPLFVCVNVLTFGNLVLGVRGKVREDEPVAEEKRKEKQLVVRWRERGEMEPDDVRM